MMGSQGGEQEQLFYSFSLEDHVPKYHLLRGIDREKDRDHRQVFLRVLRSKTAERVRSKCNGQTPRARNEKS